MDLSDDEKLARVALLKRTIEDDRYLLSPAASHPKLDPPPPASPSRSPPGRRRGRKWRVVTAISARRPGMVSVVFISLHDDDACIRHPPQTRLVLRRRTGGLYPTATDHHDRRVSTLLGHSASHSERLFLPLSGLSDDGDLKDKGRGESIVFKAAAQSLLVVQTFGVAVPALPGAGW